MWRRWLPGALILALAIPLSGCGSQTATGETTAATVAARLSVPISVARQDSAAPFDATRRLTLPRGWSASVWARVPSARLAAWTPEGGLLVSSPDRGTVTLLTAGANPAASPSATIALKGLNLPQGLAFDRVAGREVLYVAETNQIDRYEWRGHGVGARTVLVRGLPTGSGHVLKNVVVAADHTIFFDIGSASNAAPQPPTRGLPRAAVIVLRPGRRPYVWATGIRNGDGLSIAPDGTLWTAINERDDIGYPFHRPYGGHRDAFLQVMTRYVADHPPDEIVPLPAGRNVGWPFCNPDPDVHPGRQGTALSYANMPLDTDQQANTNGHVLNCARLPRIERGIPAHSAPLGFHFLTSDSVPARWRHGAVVAVHGSWDRVPPRPPAVLWLPWDGRRHTLGAATTLVGGFQNPDGSRWGRPVDVVPGPDGALYVTDDTASAVYRIVPR